MVHLDENDLAGYFDRSLGPEARRLAEAHLADCLMCRQRLAAQVRAARGLEIRDEGRVGVWSGVRPPAVSAWRRDRRATWLLAASLAAALIAVGVWRVRDRDGGPAVATGGTSGERSGGAVASPAASPAPVPPGTKAPPARPTAPPAAASGERDEPGGAAPAAAPSASQAPPPAPPPAQAPPPAPAEPQSTPAPSPVAPPSAAEPDVDGPPLDESLLALRGSTRRVDGKTFRLSEGEWVDADYAPAAPGEPVLLTRGSADYADLAARQPALARYASVGERVLVVIDGVPYRILTAPPPSPR